ncbi:MAG: FimB/Mfa2 family fimbrial subunit [Prevotella sp.]|nr:FimB/Mfa2 family fimbrial subunit [Prevotella sp.]
MTSLLKKLLAWGCITLWGSLFTACSTIDDNAADCESDFHIEYEVRLKTNLQTELQTELRNRFEDNVANLLQDSLKNIFSEFAHDIDLSFFNTNVHKLTYYVHRQMEAEQAVYTLELPVSEYNHLALANIDKEKEVDMSRGDIPSVYYLRQEKGDTIYGHSTGLFSARKRLNVEFGKSQTFEVLLSMVNCANILVVKTNGVEYKDMQVACRGFADGFYVADSVYTHNEHPVLRDYRVTKPPVEREVFYAVSFPSYDTAEEAQTDTRDDSETARLRSIWQMYVNVTMPDNTITRTTLYIDEPLSAGQIKVVYALLKDDGSVYSPNVEIGTSVEFNWREGLGPNPGI